MRGVRTERTGVAAAVWSVLAGGVVGLMLGGAAIGLVREQLHVSCSMGAPGSEGAGSWTCADGIGYLWWAGVLGLMWIVAVVIGGLVALLVRHDRVARVCLVLLAAASVVWILGWTRHGSAALVQDEYAPRTGPEYWDSAVGPAAVAAVVGVVVGIVSVLLSGRVAWVLGLVAPLGLVVAMLLQPGIGVGIAPAAGLLVAAAARGFGLRRG